VFFDAHGRLDTQVHDRETFASASGPAIVEEWATTVVVPPGWTANTDRLGNLLLRREG
jgi:N-methylhydantoinase A